MNYGPYWNYLSDKGKATAELMKVRHKKDAPRFGLCWLFGKVVRLVPSLRWDERVTTIGRTMWVVDRWYSADPLAQAMTIEHEAHHVRQLKWGPWYWLSYVLVLPLGLSMRGVWEGAAFLRGFGVKYRATKPYAVHVELDAHRLTDTLCGKPYLYALWLARPIVLRVVRKKLKRIANV